jgi:hypothetical protein
MVLVTVGRKKALEAREREREREREIDKADLFVPDTENLSTMI